MDQVRGRGAAASWRCRTCAPACARSPPLAAAATRAPTSSSPSTGRTWACSRSTRPRSSRAAKKEPGVVDVDTSLNVGKPELSVQLDRMKAADLGVQISDAAEALRLLVGGDQVTTYNEARRAVRGARARGAGQPPDRGGDRAADGAVDARPAASPLQNIAQLTPGTAPSEINRSTASARSRCSPACSRASRRRRPWTR